MKPFTQGPPPQHSQKPGRVSLWLAVLISLHFSFVKAEEPAANEAQPPDVLDLVVTGTGTTADWINVEAVLKPAIDSQAILEVEAASGARLVSGGRKKSVSLKRGAAATHEKLEVNIADGQPHKVQVKLRLLNDEGKIWMVIDREVKVQKTSAAPPPPPAADDERVPVVRTLPDGTKIVERMTRREARKLGLPENGVPATRFRRIPMNGQPAATKKP